MSIKSLPNLLFGVLCLPGDQSHPFAQPTINPLACCICWTGLLGRAVFPPCNEGPNFGSYRFIDGCANRVTLISWEAEHTEQQIGQAFYRQKNHTISILHTGYKVIGYMFAKQSYWYKLRGLHVYKAILLAQTLRALVQT